MELNSLEVSTVLQESSLLRVTQQLPGLPGQSSKK